MRNLLLLFFTFAFSTALVGQGYTREDSLRGSITPERAWWNLFHYDLRVNVYIENQTISGSNTIRYAVLEPSSTLQIDLQAPLIIDKVTQGDVELAVHHYGNAHFIQLEEKQQVGDVKEVTVFYHGIPHVAQRAPWDGGVSWSRDSSGKPFVATSNQGIGASIWWPCKDHLYDENEEGMTMSFTVPEDLVAVGNGRLIKTKRNKKESTKTYTWQVVNPINNYGVNLNIGDYVSFSEQYDGEKGKLDMIYYVLRENLEKAKVHFEDAVRTMEAFEYWFGPYPFYEDSYKLVEVPYLGMEHQSSVTYGNGYEKGYRGRDLSRTGWGLKWDYIIVHESGHEWFANNITYKDPADMWIHESFTCYSESLFTEYHYGKEASAAYVRGMRYSIANRGTLIGDYGVNDRGDDLYNKGANILHTLRQVVNDDEQWRSILRGLNKEFYHQTVTTRDIEDYIAKTSGIELSTFFDQYLRDPRVPVLEYRVKDDNSLMARWTNCIEGFNMPVTILDNGEQKIIRPGTRWRSTGVKIATENIVINPDYYVYSERITFN